MDQTKSRHTHLHQKNSSCCPCCQHYKGDSKRLAKSVNMEEAL
jgi:hypothetical protein